MKPKRSFMTKDFAISKESHSEGWTMPYMHYHDSYESYILESGSRIVTIGDNERMTSHYLIKTFLIPAAVIRRLPEYVYICLIVLPTFILPKKPKSIC